VEEAMQHQDWRVRIAGVRRHDLVLRWTIRATADRRETTLWVDSGEDGAILDVQSDDVADTALELAACDRIADVLEVRAVLADLLEAHRARWGRLRA
jgi:hypothetical protein